MNTNNNAPTFEEFKEAVYKLYAPLVKSIYAAHPDLPSPAEYMETEEAETVIKNRYKTCLDKFNKGEITRRIFLESVTASVADCLSLMY